MIDKLDEAMNFLQSTTAGLPYNPPSYTCIREFTDNFAEHNAAAPEYTASPIMPKPEWIPEAPCPKIYTENYEKTILKRVK